VPVAWCLTLLSWHLVERPFLLRKDRASDDVGSSGTAAPVDPAWPTGAVRSPALASHSPFPH